MFQLLAIDIYHRGPEMRGIMHGSAVVLPAAFAMAEYSGADGKLLFKAFIAGVEIEYAIAEYCGAELYFVAW